MLKCPANINFSALAATYFKNNLVILSRSGGTPPAVIINKGNPAITDKSINLFDENLLESFEPPNGGLFINRFNKIKTLGTAGMDYKVSSHIKVVDKLLLSHVEPYTISTNCKASTEDPLFYWNPNKLLSEADVAGDKEEYFVFAKSEFDIFKKLEEAAEPAIKVVSASSRSKVTTIAMDLTTEEVASSNNNYNIKQAFINKPEVAKYISQRKKVDDIISQNFTEMAAVINGMKNIVL